MRHIKFSSVGRVLDYRKLYKTRRKIKYIIVHTSVSKPKSDWDARGIDRDHRNRWGRRSGCGYHYVVKWGGQLEKGRWADFPGAHVKGYNKYSLGIVYIGGLNEEGIATDDILPNRQRQVLINTLRELKKLYPHAKILGHKEFPNVNKSCPCMDMSRLRREVEGRLF